MKANHDEISRIYSSFVLFLIRHNNTTDERNTIQSLKSIATYAGVGVTSTLANFLISEKVGFSYGTITVIICVMAFALMLPASFKLKERFNAENEE